MSRRFLLMLLAPALLGAGALFLGRGSAAATPPAPSADFVLHVPCVLSSPLQRVLIAYRKHRPDARVQFSTDKPLAMLGRVRQGQQLPGVVLTLGEVEMRVLVKSGAVDPKRVTAFGRNAYHLAVIVPGGNTSVTKVADVTKVKRVAIEDPKLSTLGDRARQAFTKLGLWRKLERKVVRFDPERNVLSQLLIGKADAAVVFQDCLLEGGTAPSTVRIVGTVPDRSYAPIVYQAAPLKSPAPTPAVRDFLAFLTSREGKQALKQAGLRPA